LGRDVDIKGGSTTARRVPEKKGSRKGGGGEGPSWGGEGERGGQATELGDPYGGKRRVLTLKGGGGKKNGLSEKKKKERRKRVRGSI